jgi:hypothetical protein
MPVRVTCIRLARHGLSLGTCEALRNLSMRRRAPGEDGSRLHISNPHAPWCRRDSRASTTSLIGRAPHSDQPDSRRVIPSITKKQRYPTENRTARCGARREKHHLAGFVALGFEVSRISPDFIPAGHGATAADEPFFEIVEAMALACHGSAQSSSPANRDEHTRRRDRSDLDRGRTSFRTRGANVGRISSRVGSRRVVRLIPLLQLRAPRQASRRPSLPSSPCRRRSAQGRCNRRVDPRAGRPG